MAVIRDKDEKEIFQSELQFVLERLNFFSTTNLGTILRAFSSLECT